MWSFHPIVQWYCMQCDQLFAAYYRLSSGVDWKCWMWKWRTACAHVRIANYFNLRYFSYRSSDRLRRRNAKSTQSIQPQTFAASEPVSYRALLCPAIGLFHVLQFHALQIGPSISRPSFSRPAFLAPPSYVCLSVCDAALWLNDNILQQKCLNKWIGSALPGARIYNFRPPTLTLSPQTPQLVTSVTSGEYITK